MKFSNHNKNRGFTLLELVISIAILGTLIATVTPSFLHAYQSVKEKSYMVEAESVYRAIELYILDQDMAESKLELEEERFQICVSLMESLDDKDHVLKPYLSGSTSKGAMIKGIEFGGEWMKLDMITYVVSGYVIEVKASGGIEIKSRP
ncbi:MAG: type II secretion system protein [Clostridium sp.]